MIVWAILSTVFAVVATFMVLFANGMASSPQPFYGSAHIAIVWIVCAVCWLAWYFR